MEEKLSSAIGTNLGGIIETPILELVVSVEVATELDTARRAREESPRLGRAVHRRPLREELGEPELRLDPVIPSAPS
jgi:hypothetical protein